MISRRAKLDLRLDSMVVRADDTVRIHLSEISILIVESTEVSMTAALLSELMKRKVKVIFCDEKRNPSSELISYYGSHDTSSKIRQQIAWTDNVKGNVWTEIVSEKIRQQRDHLSFRNRKEAKLLSEYLSDIQYNDSSNREGHSAKVYFNALFGMDFSRTLDTPLNAALNYGYSIILSAVNREIVKSGYITQLGLFHNNIFNQFNLGSDLMEPFRPFIDRYVYDMGQISTLKKKKKMSIINLLNNYVTIDGKTQYLNNAIGIYCRSIFDALNENDVALIRFCHYEL